MFDPLKFAVLAVVGLGTSVAGGQNVSFTNDVAPVIVAKCGSCHVANAKGSFGIESYEALMDSGSVIAGDSEGSQFIEVIESEEMPKGKLKVSEGELSTLKKWIAQGASFDGKSASKPLMPPVAGNRQQGGQRGGEKNRSGPARLQAVRENPQAVGGEGVVWYVTWDTAVAEAKRSNRPIFFMSAAAQCSGVSGVF